MSDAQKAEVVKGFEAVLANEDAFLEKIFNGYQLKCIHREDLWHYLRHRANDRLRALGIDYAFDYDRTKADSIRKWFEPVLKGQVSNDFFALQKEGSMYVAKPSQTFKRVNWKTLDLSLV